MCLYQFSLLSSRACSLLRVCSVRCCCVEVRAQKFVSVCVWALKCSTSGNGLVCVYMCVCVYVCVCVCACLCVFLPTGRDFRTKLLHTCTQPVLRVS